MIIIFDAKLPADYSGYGFKALVRHAVMTEEVENKTWKPLNVKRLPLNLKSPSISDDVRLDYEYEMTERAGIYMEMGLSQSEADKRAAEDLGCVEFWSLVVERESLPMPRAARPGLSLVGFCSRCESIGHAVERCPFSDDEQTRKIALARRGRRAERAA